MKAIIYLEGGSKLTVELLTPPTRKERESQTQLEQRLTEAFNASQPHMVHKAIRMRIMRN